MNEQELKDAISDMQECRELIGKANMRLNNILTQRKADMQKKLDDAYDRGYKKCLSEHEFDMPCSICDDYERGLNDAWDAARKIVTWPDRSLVNSDTFDLDPGENIFTKYSASEAITKLSTYEEEQKSKIRFGDEVVVYDKHKGLVVSHEHDDCDNIWVLIAKYSTPQKVNKRSVSKTGRHFDIESILKEQSE